ncbi:hypothetical protein PBY51_011544 [Eleginops maclovinus]|uniref:Uncharacterized protein n=1 Tax=Eleginops maclovinus TaxID=56733 RepID=A0AAN7XRL1_ELEMC|nr:hypothetical protein PBY51_011544 [Eleginops maclovinus]
MGAIIPLRGFEEDDEMCWAKKTTAGINSLESNTASSNYIEHNTSLLLTAKCKTNRRQQKLMESRGGGGSGRELMPSYTTHTSR